MKLIVTGATGYVATEVIRQSLRRRDITSVVALARRPVVVPPDVDVDVGEDGRAKLKSVVVEDFGVVGEEVRREIEGGDACIWTLAIPPTKSRSMEWEEVRRVCQDYTLTGLAAVFETRNQSKPFRFLYMSGSSTERDQTKTPAMMPQYLLMRGEVENQVLAFAAERQGEMEVCVVKPGLIKSPGINVRSVFASAASAVGAFPSVALTEVSAAMLDQVVNGFEKETLANEDLVRIGRRVLLESEK